MSEPIVVALDAMGGDRGADVVIPGAAIALRQNARLRFVMFGDEAVLKPLLDAHAQLAAASRIVHTDVAVQMHDKPSQALRHGRWRSSMWLALDAVRAGDAQVAVSAGNTGALMAMSRFCLKTMAKVDRPAIAAIWPTLKGESIVLDVGATIGADASQLVDFAVMGEAMARALLGKQRPSVGLLNIGVEEVKGLEDVREAHQRLKNSNLPIQYVGFVEGDDLGRGTADVVVTEGFSGNIALKTAEGTARQVGEYLRSQISRSFMARIGYLFARGAFTALRNKLDPQRSNGGVFLGLNGIVIKSHGGTSAEGFASAIAMGYEMFRNNLMAKIEADLSAYHASRDADATLQQSSVAS